MRRGGIVPKFECGSWSAENAHSQSVDGGYIAVTWFGRMFEIAYGSRRRWKRYLKRLGR